MQDADENRGCKRDYIPPFHCSCPQLRNKKVNHPSTPLHPTPHLSTSLPLLPFVIPQRLLTPQPNPNKAQPPDNRNPHASNPHPRPGNLPTPRPLIVREMPYRDLFLYVDIRQKGAFVIDAEVEDAVLVREAEGGAEDGGVGGGVAG